MENSLNCSADRCVNNTGGFCTASIITVEGLNAVRKEVYLLCRICNK